MIYVFNKRIRTIMSKQDFMTRILSWIRVKLIQGKVTRTKTFINLMSQWFRKIAVLRLYLYLFEWFVIIECERTDKYTNVFTKKLSTRNSLNYIHNDRYCNRKSFHILPRNAQIPLNNYLAIRQMLNLLCWNVCLFFENSDNNFFVSTIYFV